MRAQRIRNGLRRVAKAVERLPLFEAQIRESEFARSKYTLEACEADARATEAVDVAGRERWWREHPVERRVLLPGAVDTVVVGR
jgi:hypothetical protein